MSFPFFSIIIPVYNGSSHVSEAVRSMQEQTFTDFELIIINDGSTDDTTEVVLPFLEDKRISLYSQLNRGVSAARNTGVKYANGQFLLFIDCDDKPFLTMLEDFFSAIKRHPDCLICFAQYFNQGKLRGLRHNKYLFDQPASVIPGSYCIERNIFIKMGGFDEGLLHSENWELMIRLGLQTEMKADRIINLEKPVLLYTAKYSREKLLSNKKNKIVSYGSLYEKHKETAVYSKSLVAYFAQVVANNYAGLGNFKETINWTVKSINTWPFLISSYYKPVTIFFKRRVFPYS